MLSIENLLLNILIPPLLCDYIQGGERARIKITGSMKKIVFPVIQY